jgi:hypothetical protein
MVECLQVQRSKFKHPLHKKKKKKKKEEEEERKRKKDVSFHQTFFLFALTQSQACIKV